MRLITALREAQGATISTKDRKKVNAAFDRSTGLDGTGRFGSVGEGLRKITDVLSRFGYTLNMVSNDFELAQAHHKPDSTGTRQLRFSRATQGGDPFVEGEEITNSVVHLSWANVSPGPKPMEILVYLS